MTASIATSTKKYCWFLTGSQGLYGPETVAQVVDQSRVIVDQINASDQIAVEVVWKPVLTDSESIHRLILEANADPDCIGVIAWMHTFSPAKMWIAGLDALRTPLLHLHTQASMGLPWDTIDMDYMNLNQSAHGDREFAYIASRLGKARRTVVGHASSPRSSTQPRSAAIGTMVVIMSSSSALTCTGSVTTSILPASSFETSSTSFTSSWRCRAARCPRAMASRCGPASGPYASASTRSL